MAEPEITTEEKDITTPAIVEEVSSDIGAGAPVVAKPAFGSNSSFGGFGDRKRNTRPQRKTKRDPRAKPEYDQRMINIRRVTRVSSGGRRFSFSVVLVVGNRKGSVGVATGKAGDTTLAIDKAYRAAKKNAIQVKLLKNMSIPHEVSEKFKGSVVSLSPAKGKGMIAGSAARDVIELAGIKDINAKIHSPSKNKTTYTPKKEDRKLEWYFIDAENKILGKVAVEATKALMGKNRANLTFNINTGDKVVITNAEKIAVTGKKLTDKIYTHYTGFPGGLRTVALGKVLKENPTKVLRMAVQGMLPKNKLRDVRLANLYIYVGSEHPHKGQEPKPVKK